MEHKMDKSSEMRAALLKQLIGAIGSNRIKGFSVEKLDLHDPVDAEKLDPMDAECDMEDKEPEEDIEELLKEARAARAAKKG